MSFREFNSRIEVSKTGIATRAFEGINVIHEKYKTSIFFKYFHTLTKKKEANVDYF